MTLIEHLAELRNRLFICIIAVAVCGTVVFFLFPEVLDFLSQPYRDITAGKEPCPADGCSLIATDPLAPFMVRIKVAVYGGMALALPIIMWQIWRFVVPAMHAKEKKYAVPFVLSSVFLFLLGGVVAYFTLTPALDFLITWAGDDVDANFQVSKYVSLFGLMVLAFGITFLFPVLLVFLQLVGVLTPQVLQKNWRYAVVIIFVIAAVITPSGDPYSMMAMAIPMTLFYVISIVIGRIAQKRKRAREATTT